MPADAMDCALILTSDGSKEVRDAAAEAIKEMSGAGVDKTPQFKPASAPEIPQNSNNMELSELDTDSMLGNEGESIGSLSLGSGSGGVKMMGGEEQVASSDATFEVSETVPSFEEETPKFKPAEKKETPKFKPTKKKTPQFKVAKK